MELGGSHQNIGTQNSYKFGGKEVNGFTGYSDFGRRNFDAPIGKFNSQDRYSEKYFSLSPMGYAAQNPINIIDVNGDSLNIDNSIYSNATLNSALRHFFNSNDGFTFLSMFAKAGQKMYGKTFKKNGEFHKLGVNLNYRAESQPVGKGGDTKAQVLDKSITISLNSNPIDGLNRNESVFEKTKTIFHESFIHGEL